MLKMSLLGASWDNLVVKAPKCSERAFWGPPGTIWWPRLKNAQNEPSGGFLGPVGGQGTKMLKMSLLGASWGHLVAKARKSSKRPFWAFLGPFRGQPPKIVKMSLLGAPGAIWWPRHGNAQNELSEDEHELVSVCVLVGVSFSNLIPLLSSDASLVFCRAGLRPALFQNTSLSLSVFLSESPFLFWFPSCHLMLLLYSIELDNPNPMGMQCI